MHMPRETLWEKIYQATLGAAKLAQEGKSAHVPPLITRLLSTVLRGDMVLLIDLIEHAAKDPESNRYKILYGLAHSAHAQQFGSCVTSKQRYRIFAALQSNPPELLEIADTQQQALATTVSNTPAPPIPALPACEQLPKPAQLALRLATFPEGHRLKKLLETSVYSSQLLPHWQNELRRLKGYKPPTLNADYYMHHPYAVRPKRQHPFDVLAGRALDESAYFLGRILEPIITMKADSPLSEVFDKIRQEHAETKREIFLTRNGQLDELARWTDLQKMESQYNNKILSTETTHAQLQTYHDALYEKWQQLTSIAGIQYKNYIALDRLMCIHLPKMISAESEQQTISLSNTAIEGIKLIKVLAEIAKTYHGSIGYALASEGYDSIADIYLKAKQRRNGAPKNAYRACDKLWKKYLSDAYCDISIANELQPADPNILDNATMGFGFKLNTLAFKKRTPDKEHTEHTITSTLKTKQARLIIYYPENKY